MIRLSRFALYPMRQRACITLHHAATASSSADVQSAIYASSVLRSYTYSRYIPGPHVIMVITSTIGSSALATHEPSIHAAHTFRIATTLARPCRRNTLGWDRETRAWSPRSLRPEQPRSVRSESQGHDCKVCICLVTRRHYRFRESSLASLPPRVDKRDLTTMRIFLP